MEDHLTSADPPSYTFNRSRVDLELRGKRLAKSNFVPYNVSSAYCVTMSVNS